MLCVWLNIGGGFLEIAGFALVAYELFRTQRRELGDPWLLARLKASRDRIVVAVRKVFRRTQVHEMSANLTGAVKLTGTPLRGRVLRALDCRSRGAGLAGRSGAELPVSRQVNFCRVPFT